MKSMDKGRYVIVRHQNGGHCVTVDGPIVCTHVEAKRRARRIQRNYPDHDIEAKKIGDRSASQ